MQRLNDNKNFFLSENVSKYLTSKDESNCLTRKVSNLEYSNKFWNKILKQIKK